MLDRPLVSDSRAPRPPAGGDDERADDTEVGAGEKTAVFLDLPAHGRDQADRQRQAAVAWVATTTALITLLWTAVVESVKPPSANLPDGPTQRMIDIGGAMFAEHGVDGLSVRKRGPRPTAR